MTARLSPPWRSCAPETLRGLVGLVGLVGLPGAAVPLLGPLEREGAESAGEAGRGRAAARAAVAAAREGGAPPSAATCRVGRDCGENQWWKPVLC